MVQARVPVPTTIGMRRPTVRGVKRDTRERVVGIPAQMEVLLMPRCLPAQARVAVPEIGTLRPTVSIVTRDTPVLVARLPVMDMEHQLLRLLQLQMERVVAVPAIGIRQPSVLHANRDTRDLIVNTLMR